MSRDPKVVVFYDDDGRKQVLEFNDAPLADIAFGIIKERWPGAYMVDKSPLREAAEDDHYYGPWGGGKASQGGGPVRGPDGGIGGLRLSEKERNEEIEVTSLRNLVYPSKRGAKERTAQYKEWDEKGDPDLKTVSGLTKRGDMAGSPVDHWERDAYSAAHTARTRQEQGTYRQRAYDNMERAWMRSSKRPESVLLQSTVAEAGLGGGMVWRGQVPRPGATKFEVPTQETTEYGRKFVRDVYAKTQADLASGPEYITVYRGMSGRRRSGQEGAMSANVLESWSTSRASAAEFSGSRATNPNATILRAKVHRSAVFMNIGGYENEVVLLGSRIDRKGITQTTPPWDAW